MITHDRRLELLRYEGVRDTTWLTPEQSKILAALVDANGEVVPHAVMTAAGITTSKQRATLMARLRRILVLSGAEIHSVSQRGYRLVNWPEHG